MQKLVISILDKEANLFNEPKCVTNKAQVMREFIEMCNEDKYPFKKYPEQFCLTQLGTFDDEKGEFINAKQILLEAKTCVSKDQKK